MEEARREKYDSLQSCFIHGIMMSKNILKDWRNTLIAMSRDHEIQEYVERLEKYFNCNITVVLINNQIDGFWWLQQMKMKEKQGT